MKQLLICSLFFLLCIPALADTITEDYTNSTTMIEKGVGLGTVIAVVTSWSRNNSVLWAIFHGLCSWIYVVYFILTREER